MEKLFSIVTPFVENRFTFDDDWSDRLFHVWTCLLLIVFSALLGVGQYAGSPVSCIQTTRFTDAETYSDFAQKYCWVTGTYFIPHGENMPETHEHRKKSFIAYYQWVPFVLVLQAVLFYIPSFFWRTILDRAGYNIHSLAVSCKQNAVGSLDAQDSTIRSVAFHLKSCFSHSRRHRRNCLSCLRNVLMEKRRVFVVAFYLLAKLMYITIAIFQLWIIGSFFCTGMKEVSLDTINDYFYPTDVPNWQVTGVFPRLTFCDVKIRTLANEVTRTYQCVLPLNMFNEKFYIAFSIWLLILIILALWNFAVWIYDICLLNSRVVFVTKYVTAEIDRDFITDFLYPDGVLILRILKQNIGEIMLTKVIRKLYDEYNKDKPTDSKFPKDRIYPNIGYDCDNTLNETK